MMHFYITGDFHGRFEEICGRLENIKDFEEECGVIVLGDAGFNYYLNKTDKKLKQRVSEYNRYIYCVRGNHEERPENVKGMQSIWDDNVGNFVYSEPDFPLIRYLCDGTVYFIEGYKTLVIGGAYSVDKHYRLARGVKWFPDEQLSKDEMAGITQSFSGCEFDLVLTHTCPLSFQPIDLFLPQLNQSEVDKTMENWLEELKDNIKWKVWLFGHFHASRIVANGVEMFYTNMQRLRHIMHRWT